MKKNELNKKDIENLLPHREPMLLIDKLTNIAVTAYYVKVTSFLRKIMVLINTLNASTNDREEMD